MRLGAPKLFDLQRRSHSTLLALRSSRGRESVRECQKLVISSILKDRFLFQHSRSCLPHDAHSIAFCFHLRSVKERDSPVVQRIISVEEILDDHSYIFSQLVARKTQLQFTSSVSHSPTRCDC